MTVKNTTKQSRPIDTNVLNIVKSKIAKDERKTQILDYLLSGNAFFTIESSSKNIRYTYSMTRKKKTQPYYKVTRLYGPNNEKDYRYVGVFNVETFFFHFNKLDKKDKCAQLLLALFTIICSEHLQWPPACRFYKAKRCGLCHRLLTTVESIERGYGPHCYELMNKTGLITNK